MPGLATTIESNRLFQAFLSIEPGLRTQYLRLESMPRPFGDAAESPAALIETSACLLELLLVGAFVHGALSQFGYSAPGVVSREIAVELQRRTIAMYGLDPAVVYDEARRYLGVDPLEKPGFPLSVEAVLRMMKSVLEICPIDHLERIAASHRLEVSGHRCRVAYDGIKAFVLRNGPNQRAQVSVLGHAFVQGSLSVQDVATLLELHPVDAVALLESHGFSRNLDKIALDDTQRSGILAGMRQDRLSRSGKPQWTHESIARDVVASERLEGVDARRWIPRDGQ